jgi:hypothetical protein
MKRGDKIEDIIKEVLNFEILEYIPQEEIIENADATQPI